MRVFLEQFAGSCHTNLLAHDIDGCHRPSNHNINSDKCPMYGVCAHVLNTCNNELTTFSRSNVVPYLLLMNHFTLYRVLFQSSYLKHTWNPRSILMLSSTINHNSCFLNVCFKNKSNYRTELYYESVTWCAPFLPPVTWCAPCDYAVTHV